MLFHFFTLIVAATFRSVLSQVLFELETVLIIGTVLLLANTLGVSLVDKRLNVIIILEYKLSGASLIYLFHLSWFIRIVHFVFCFFVL